MIGNKNIQSAKRISRSRRIKIQSKKGRDRSRGFLHIPKTGGSAFSGFSRDMVKAGYVMPVKFGHVWTLENIVQSFPGTKVSFMVRDPLERTISAFNSRLRQGRPRHSNNWSMREAVAFSLFSDAETFLRALISEEDRDISAVHYALRNIIHLRWNYCNYFEGTAKLQKYRSSIQLVGETNNSLPFWKNYRPK